MILKINIGEGSGAVIIFFFWLVIGLELSTAWDAIGWIYFLVSFVVYLIWVAIEGDLRDKDVGLTQQDLRAKRAARILLPRPIEEKHYALGWVSLVILKGPVKLTPWRTVIFLGIIGAGFAVFFFSLARASPHRTDVTMLLIFAGIFLVLLVINFLEVRWRKADALKSNPRNTAQ